MTIELDTGSRDIASKCLQVSFKCIANWTTGTSLPAWNSTDIMLDILCEGKAIYKHFDWIILLLDKSWPCWCCLSALLDMLYLRYFVLVCWMRRLKLLLQLHDHSVDTWSFTCSALVLCGTYDTTTLIVDTYVMIPVSPRSRYTAVYRSSKNTMRWHKYRNTVELVPLRNECTLQACNAKTNSHSKAMRARLGPRLAITKYNFVFFSI